MLALATRTGITGISFRSAASTSIRTQSVGSAIRVCPSGIFPAHCGPITANKISVWSSTPLMCLRKSIPGGTLSMSRKTLSAPYFETSRSKILPTMKPESSRLYEIVILAIACTAGRLTLDHFIVPSSTIQGTRGRYTSCRRSTCERTCLLLRDGEQLAQRQRPSSSLHRAGGRIGLRECQTARDVPGNAVGASCRPALIKSAEIVFDPG